jgi:phosphate/sulfate permease
MGLLLLVLVGFLPFHYSLDVYHDSKVVDLQSAIPEAKALLKDKLEKDPNLTKTITALEARLANIQSFRQVPDAERWDLRKLIFDLSQALKRAKAPDELQSKFTAPIEFVPLWVIIGTALALGIGTTVGYKRIVVTVAEKIGKQHLTYAQGAVAESVTVATILTATLVALPVSTTQILSSGIAGTMAANRSGIQFGTARKILLAWVFTLPATMLIAGTLFCIGRELFVK